MTDHQPVTVNKASRSLRTSGCDHTFLPPAARRESHRALGRPVKKPTTPPGIGRSAPPSPPARLPALTTDNFRETQFPRPRFSEPFPRGLTAASSSVRGAHPGVCFPDKETQTQTQGTRRDGVTGGQLRRCACSAWGDAGWLERGRETREAGGQEGPSGAHLGGGLLWGARGGGRKGEAWPKPNERDCGCQRLSCCCLLATPSCPQKASQK